MRCWLGKTLAGAALAVAAGALGFATPASADVTVDPDVSVQGGAPRLTFTVTNSSPTATLNQVTLKMPDSMPIAEVYPLSIDDWAPRIDMKPLAQPLTGVHGTQVTEYVTDIIWFAMPGKGVKPGGTADIKITLGPLPVAEQVVFTVIEGYDDGSTMANDAIPAVGSTVKPPKSAAVLRLIPDPTGGQPHNGTGGHSGTDSDVAATPVEDDGESNTGAWIGIIGMAAGLIGGGAIAWLIAAGRRVPPPAQTPATADVTPKTSTEPDSVWRYRGDSAERDSAERDDAGQDDAGQGDAAEKVRETAGKTA